MLLLILLAFAFVKAAPTQAAQVVSSAMNTGLSWLVDVAHSLLTFLKSLVA